MNLVYPIWNIFLFFFFEMVIFTTLFQHCPTLWTLALKTTLFWHYLALFISTWKYITLIQRCSTLSNQHVNGCWFDVFPRRDVILTKGQRWNNGRMFAGYQIAIIKGICRVTICFSETNNIKVVNWVICLQMKYILFYKQYFYKQHEAAIGYKSSKT